MRYVTLVALDGRAHLRRRALTTAVGATVGLRLEIILVAATAAVDKHLAASRVHVVEPSLNRRPVGRNI